MWSLVWGRSLLGPNFFNPRLTWLTHPISFVSFLKQLIWAIFMMVGLQYNESSYQDQLWFILSAFERQENKLHDAGWQIFIDDVPFKYNAWEIFCTALFLNVHICIFTFWQGFTTLSSIILVWSNFFFTYHVCVFFQIICSLWPFTFFLSFFCYSLCTAQ